MTTASNRKESAMVFFINSPLEGIANWPMTILPNSPSSTPSVDYKIMFIGDDFTGKTSLIHRYFDKTFLNPPVTTVGVDFKKSTIDTPQQQVKLKIWDIGGQEQFRELQKPYYKEINTFVICFSLDDEPSFIHLHNWLCEIKRNSIDKQPQIILAATKADVGMRLITDDRIHQYIYNWNKKYPHLPISGYVETSAKSGMNVEVLLQKSLQQNPTENQLEGTFPVELEAPSRTQLLQRLDRYISETAQKKDAQGNLTGGFWFCSTARAYNREIDYHIAVKLRDELDSDNSLSNIFQESHLIELRQQILHSNVYLSRGNPGFFSLQHDISRSSLGAIWNQGIELARQELRCELEGKRFSMAGY